VGGRLGVDVGGTFTDLALDDGERLIIAKVPSTPADQAEGILAGMERLGAGAGDLTRFVHGTTVATNAVLERGGARTVLVCTEGFRDLLEIGRQDRPSLYDLKADRPPPLVPRELVVEAPERITAHGESLRPLLDPGAVAEAVRGLGPEAVAVCLLFSFLAPDHERAIAEALQGLPVSISSEILPVFREYERASTTALNAYVAPVLARYLGSLTGRLRSVGVPCEVEVMRSGGGTFSAEVASRLAVHTLLSGPAAGAWGAAAVGAAAGHPDLIAFDMGGTSTDVTLIEGGRPGIGPDGRIAGLPFAVASTDVHTVGAGGGSVAWRDEGGALRVGPRSAGADPGPACYGRGGGEPTVTDAYLSLGLLDPSSPLGGVLALDRRAAEATVGDLGRGLGLDVQSCAQGIVRVAEAQVARALRVVSVERGLDPRGYALLAFGGAGPLHQGPLARELGCPAVIVPPNPGVLAAIGLLAAPAAADVAATRVRSLETVSAGELEEGWRRLEAEARALLARQGVSDPRLGRSADCRYRGQAHELEVAASGPARSALAEGFHAAHRERYGYVHEGETVEVVNLRVRAEGPTPALPIREPPPGRGAESARRGSRVAVVEGAPEECPVYDRAALGPGDRVSGPALVTSVDSTCLLLGGQQAEVDGLGNLVIRER
jgi:N-methylhydantoinase A